MNTNMTNKQYAKQSSQKILLYARSQEAARLNQNVRLQEDVNGDKYA